MSEHRVHVAWERGGVDFGYESYPRDHRWRFEGGVEVPGTAAPAFRGDPKRVDPEAAFVAALSSCHMLTFLYVAAKHGFVVDAYADDAVGVMTKNEAGRMWVSKVTLAPAITFSGEKRPTPQQLDALHHLAHDECYIANSVKSEVVVQGSTSFA